MPRIVATPFCHVVLLGAWNESPRRRFAAYRCRGSLPRVLGHAVVDEFATLSSPIFVCRRAMAGKIYDAGLTLAHRRGSELGIDAGWPPFVVALDEPGSGPTREPPPKLAADWQDQLLAALGSGRGDSDQATPNRSAGFSTRRVGKDRLWWAQLGDVDVLVTDAPLLPKQLGRLCEASPRACTIAVSEGQVIVASNDGERRIVRAVSEERLASLGVSFRTMLAESP